MVSRSTFVANSATYGGGIHYEYMDVATTLDHCTVAGNMAMWGGGISAVSVLRP